MARVSDGWCGRGDSNPHDLATASPSSWCVCQFRHFREDAGGPKASAYRTTCDPGTHAGSRNPRLPAAGGAPIHNLGGLPGSAGVGAAGAGVAGFSVGAALPLGAGVVGFCVGAGAAGADVPPRCSGARPPITEPGPRWPRMPSASAPSMNSTAATVVARDSTVAPLGALALG